MTDGLTSQEMSLSPIDFGKLSKIYLDTIGAGSGYLIRGLSGSASWQQEDHRLPHTPAANLALIASLAFCMNEGQMSFIIPVHNCIELQVLVGASILATLIMQ